MVVPRWLFPKLYGITLLVLSQSVPCVSEPNMARKYVFSLTPPQGTQPTDERGTLRGSEGAEDLEEAACLVSAFVDGGLHADATPNVPQASLAYAFITCFHDGEERPLPR